MATIFYGPVRCSFVLIFLRCGAVRFFFLTVRCGANRFFLESFGAVRCGFVRGTIVRSDAVRYNRTERCGAVKPHRTAPHRTVRKKRTVNSSKITNEWGMTVRDTRKRIVTRARVQAGAVCHSSNIVSLSCESN